MKPDLLVIGGGWAGCSAALAGARRGLQVQLLEAAPRLGGRGGSFGDPQSGEELDRGQHLFLGAYRETLALLGVLGRAEQVQFQPGLRVPFLLADGRLESMELPAWSGPLGLALALRRFPPLRGKGAGALIKLGLRRLPELARAAWGRPASESAGLSVQAWLGAAGRDADLRAHLWEPLCLAALNAPLEKARAREFAAALGQGFLRGGRRAALGWSKVPLSDLLAPLGPELERRGSSLRLGAVVRSAARSAKGLWQVELEGGEVLEAPRLCLALPAAAALRLLPAETASRLGLEREAARPRSTIVTAWLWSAAPILPEPLLAFGPQSPGLAPRFHWGFSRPPREAGGEWRSALLASAAPDLAAQGPAGVLKEASSFLAARGRPFRFERGRALAEPAATPVFEPGSPPRLPQATAERGLALAGDWTETGLPATIEGAVLAGRLAAQALARA